MNRRLEFAQRAQESCNFRALCREYGISPKTGYKWKGRLEDEGLRGFAEKSRRPHRKPTEMGDDVICDVVALKLAHPAWGPKKLKVILGRKSKVNLSESSIKRVLDKAGLVKKRRVRSAREGGRLHTDRKAAAPNEVWTVDFKGWWYDAEGRSNPLTIRDEFSRYVLDIRHLDNATTLSVKACFERLFHEHGLPQAIRSDNGSPFASVNAIMGLSQLSVWWLSLGIELERSRPGCPQDNGGHERMHADIARELQRVRVKPESRQAAFDQWREEFNTERPHEALGMKCPADVWRRSQAKYDDQRDGFDYGDWETRLVDTNGFIRFRSHRYRISSVFRTKELGVTPMPGGNGYHVYFGSLLLGEIDPQKLTFTGGQSPSVGAALQGNAPDSATPHQEHSPSVSPPPRTSRVTQKNS